MNKPQTDLIKSAGSISAGYEGGFGCFALAVPFETAGDRLSKQSMWLEENDVTPEEACLRIRSLDDMRSYFRFARQQVEAGGRKNLRNAERITRLCLVHPFLGDAVDGTIAPLMNKAGSSD
jgi:hypothetical protein